MRFCISPISFRYFQLSSRFKFFARKRLEKGVKSNYENFRVEKCPIKCVLKSTFAFYDLQADKSPLTDSTVHNN